MKKAIYLALFIFFTTAAFCARSTLMYLNHSTHKAYIVYAYEMINGAQELYDTIELAPSGLVERDYQDPLRVIAQFVIIDERGKKRVAHAPTLFSFHSDCVLDVFEDHIEFSCQQ